MYSPVGDKLALVNGGTLIRAFVPLPAGATAVYVPGLSLSYYRHADWLGSARFASTPSRTLYYDGAYAPFGEPYAETGTTDRSFTGQNSDTTADLYDFMFREYNYTHGRWLSPDPVAGNMMNPQSLNRYAYVINNPVNFTDPLGLQNCPGASDPRDCQDYRPWGGSTPFDRRGSMYDIQFGYDIFDALSGLPGTSLTFDYRGNLGWGFSIDLWRQTWTFIDGTRESFAFGGVYDPGRVPTSGYIVVQDNFGTYAKTTGIIPGGEALGMEALQLIGRIPDQYQAEFQQLAQQRGQVHALVGIGYVLEQSGNPAYTNVIFSIVGWEQRISDYEQHVCLFVGIAASECQR